MALLYRVAMPIRQINLLFFTSREAGKDGRFQHDQ
jgi:hypothetical protein